MRRVNENLWQCKLCTFQNKNQTDICQICQNINVTDRNLIQPSKNISKSAFICHICSYENDNLMKICKGCNQILIPSDSQNSEAKSDQQVSMENFLKCLSCFELNDLSNIKCAFCDAELKNKKKSKQVDQYKPKKIKKQTKKQHKKMKYKCKFCNRNQMDELELQMHEISCFKIPRQEIDRRYTNLKQNHCSICYQKTLETLQHEKSCKERINIFSAQNEHYKRLTKVQLQAILYMQRKSEKLHVLSEPTLLKKIFKLGYEAKDLQNLHHYIVNYAPIIIHVRIQALIDKFLNDTHYRNMFEVRNITKDVRVGWENRLFDKIYHKATAFERVKYGVVNFTNDPKGVKVCQGYGSSYFLLKPDIKKRCTLTNMDSGGYRCTIGTFNFCFHILNKLTDQQIHAAFSASKGEQISSHPVSIYKQIQIHGPIEFKEDIERIYVNKLVIKQKEDLKQKVQKFCQLNKLEYELF